ICASVDQPSELTPRNPLRKAARDFPSSFSASTFQKEKAPETAHSPGSAARSNTKVSDGSSRMVRKSFMKASRPIADQSRKDAPAQIRAFSSLSRQFLFCALKDRPHHRLCAPCPFPLEAVEDNSSRRTRSRPAARRRPPP